MENEQIRGAVIDTMTNMSEETQKWVLIMTLATKLNFWLTNHHTGIAYKISGISLKCFNACPLWKEIPETMRVIIIHTWGHWVSTLYTLGRNVMACRGVEDTTVALHNIPCTVTISSDFQLRARSLCAAHRSRINKCIFRSRAAAQLTA